MDLTEAEYINKRCQEYTEELYNKDLNDPDAHDGVIAHLEPDILECEVKWALGSITTNKASGGDGIPAESASESHSVSSDSLRTHGLYSPWNSLGQWHPTPVLLPRKSHGQRSLVGSSPWGR